MSIGSQPVGLWDSASNSYFNTNIPFDVAAWTLQGALRNIGGFSAVEVYRDGNPWYGTSRWIISYWKANVDVPNLVLSGAQLTGGKTGTSPQISFT